MRALLERLGDPAAGVRRDPRRRHEGQVDRDAHAAALLATMAAAAAYTSPHVAGWHERLDTDADGFERAVARVRPTPRRSARRSSRRSPPPHSPTSPRAARRRGRRGRARRPPRRDERRSTHASCSSRTSVSSTPTCSDRHARGDRRREARRRAGRAAVVVLPDDEFARARRRGATVRHRRRREGGRGVPRPRRSSALVEASARRAARASRDGEVRDGAHTPEAVDWLLERLPEPRDYVVVASILGDKDADGILDAPRARRARRSSRPRRRTRGRCPPRRSPTAPPAIRPRRDGRRPGGAARALARASAGRCSSPVRSTSLPTSLATTEMHTMSRP